MLFNSINFIIFFPIVTVLYFIIPKKIRYLWLLVASYFFYMGWNPKYALLLLFSTLITYLSGIFLDVLPQKFNVFNETLYRKAVVVCSFTINLGVLFFYKYINFILDIFVGILGKAHINVTVPTFDVILPVGISFFTFQALSYTMDVYRKEIYAEKNFFRYALYVSFFPQLVAGPIERSKNLLKQLAVSTSFNFEQARDGLLLMLWGYFLKLVIADRVAIVVNVIYNSYEKYPGYYLIVASVLFAVQIYCDFAGYSTIAIGVAKILGIRLMENFDAPYTAQSISEFWRRWHISLTSWFKDYLYIPMGGSKKGKLRANFNKLTVFLLSGLWHGASLHYVAWGGINGLYQIIGNFLEPLRAHIVKILRLNPDSLGFKLYKVIITFILVDFSWIYFRASSLRSANAIVHSIMTANNPWILFDSSLYQLGLHEKDFRLMIICIFVLIIVDIFKHYNICIRAIILKQDYIVRWLVIVFSIIFILIFGVWGPGYNASNFIYFQF